MKNVRTKVLAGSENVVAGTTVREVLAYWLCQDNIRIIGCEVKVDINVPDTAMNADHLVVGTVDLTRAPHYSQDGDICQAGIRAIWTAAILAGGDLVKNLVMMFPEGYGINVDEGEFVNLLCDFAVVGTITISMYGTAIVYYVER